LVVGVLRLAPVTGVSAEAFAVSRALVAKTTSRANLARLAAPASHDIRTGRAFHLGAVRSKEAGVTDAATDLISIPRVIVHDVLSQARVVE